MSSLGASKQPKNATALNKKQNSSIACTDIDARNVKQPQKKAAMQTKPSQSKFTKIVVKCNCGFPNNLYLRGEGISGLSWDKGVLMKCAKSDEWIWETDKPFNHAEVKIVLNDKQYEVGANHGVDCGQAIKFSPRF